MPTPLPTLSKALPGYKCCQPACVQALQAVDETTVACPLGHAFPRDPPFVLPRGQHDTEGLKGIDGAQESA